MSGRGVQLLSLAVVVLCLCQKIESGCDIVTIDCNDTANHTFSIFSDATASAFGIAFIVVTCVSLFLGVVLGVAGSVAAYKLMKWMEGKTVVFSPWPRIQPAMETEESALQNPTYEIGGNGASTDKRCVKNAGHALPHQNTKKSLEVYEAVEEPINEAESLEPSEQFTPLPYAIHDFSEGGGGSSVEDHSSVAIKGPPIASKVNINRPKKGKGKNLDIRRSMSESGRLEAPTEKKHPKPIALKPPIAQKAAALKKPPLKSALCTQSTSAAPPHGAYSELDKKTSYATLEPHIGGDEVTTPESSSKESYCHLNH